MDKDAILLILASESSKFRSQAKKDCTLFSKDTKDSAAMVMEELLSAEQESVRYRAAKFIINECAGRNDVNVQSFKGLNVNIMNINLRLQKAKEAKNKAKFIDVESSIAA